MPWLQVAATDRLGVGHRDATRLGHGLGVLAGNQTGVGQCESKSRLESRHCLDPIGRGEDLSPSPRW